MRILLLSIALLTGTLPAHASETARCASRIVTAAMAQSTGNTAITSPSEFAPVGDIETSKVISVVSSIPLAVDLAAYDLAEQAFASSVIIDYTSLWGGEPTRMTPAELMTACDLLPGMPSFIG